jgi:hypothetical protein
MATNGFFASNFHAKNYYATNYFYEGGATTQIKIVDLCYPLSSNINSHWRTAKINSSWFTAVIRQ